MEGLEALKDLKLDAKATDNTEKKESNNADAPKYEAVIDSLGRSYATGKRKNSIAKVWIKPGKGSIVINGKKIEEYKEEQISYACKDVLYLHKIKSELEKILIRENKKYLADKCFEFLETRKDLDLAGLQTDIFEH